MEQIDLYNDPTHSVVVSRLCENHFCLNTKHTALEKMAIGRSRLSCAGPTLGCAHTPLCVMPGKYYSIVGHGALSKVIEERTVSDSKGLPPGFR